MPVESRLKDQVVDAVEADWVGFFERVCGVRWVGAPRMGKPHGCGFHEDGTASFSITRRDDGRLRWKCFGGCGGGDIFEAYQIAARLPDGAAGFRQAVEELAAQYGISEGDPRKDLPGVIRDQPAPRAGKGGEGGGLPEGAELVKTYPYVDEEGKLLFQVCRFEWEEDGRRKKTFRQRQSGDGGWVWNLESVRRVLYRLPKVVKAKALILFEGEKDVETYERLRADQPGPVATSIPMGASSWKSEFAEFFSGKRVVLSPDADDAGDTLLSEAGPDIHEVAKQVKLWRTPVGKDFTDWVEAGGTWEEFRQLVKAANDWEPPEPSSPEHCPSTTQRDTEPAPPEPAPDSPVDPTSNGTEDPLLRAILPILRAEGPVETRVSRVIEIAREVGKTGGAEEREPEILIEDSSFLGDDPDGAAFIQKGPDTGYSSLTAILHGLRAGWYVIEGFSGTGKSTFLSSLVQHSIEAGVPDDEVGEKIFPWLIVTLEDVPRAWRSMMLSRLTMLDGKCIATGEYNGQDELYRSAIREQWGRLRAIEQHIWWQKTDLYQVMLHQLAPMMEQFQQVHGGEPGAGVGGMVIDPLHGLSRPETEEGYDFIDRATSVVNDLYRQWNVPILTNVHLNRQGQAKGTSGFEFRAHIRLKLHVDEEAETRNGRIPDTEKDTRTWIRCDVVKNKNLPTGGLYLHYDKKTATFAEESTHYAQQDDARRAQQGGDQYDFPIP